MPFTDQELAGGLFSASEKYDKSRTIKGYLILFAVIVIAICSYYYGYNNGRHHVLQRANMMVYLACEKGPGPAIDPLCRDISIEAYILNSDKPNDWWVIAQNKFAAGAR